MTDVRRQLPAVNLLLADADSLGLTRRASRAVVVDAIRDALAEARARGGTEPDGGWMREIVRHVEARNRRSLVRVVNATGVVLHTNLGRAPLAAAAIDAMVDAAAYSALEYDLDAGGRGSRQRHVQGLIAELTHAEDAIVVNNAAAALYLALQALAAPGETIVSRGELVEIGGGFRIPEIVAACGTVLVEVGTTNRTRLHDYEAALTARTRCLLKVHRSNFRITGFTSEATVADLVGLARPRALPVVHDVGSGLLVDLRDVGLTGEPLVGDSVRAGAVTVFSGDKLLGGPQAGIATGPLAAIAALHQHPLARVLRADKTTLAALEATLHLYRDPGRARREIPVLAMLTAEPATLDRRARELASMLPDAVTRAGTSAVGGGTFPDAGLPTTLVALAHEAPDALLASLRRHDPPVIARAGDGCVLIDVRTLRDEELPLVANAVAAARGH